MTGGILPREPGTLTPNTVTADPYNAQTPAAALAERITPVDAIFVRDHFGIPRLELRRWRLSLGGLVEEPCEVGYDELSALGRRELDAVLECAGNGRGLMTPRPPGLPWGERAVGCARFGGVPFRAVAARARPDPRAVEFVFTGADSGDEHGRRVAFERSLPLEVALHPDTLLATHMNGVPLARVHGAPVRLVVPGRFAVADVKWLVGARAVAEPFTGVFQTDEYVYRDARGTPDGPVTTLHVKSLITAPEPDAVLVLGTKVTVRGWAWSGGVPVRQVLVRVDDEGWHRAGLERPSGPYAWTGWSLRWTPRRPGRHRLLARATDARGETQPLRAPWNAQGYGCNAASSVDVLVRRRAGRGTLRERPQDRLADMDAYEIGIVTTAPLGDTSYLLVSGDEAALVDPQRDCWGLLADCDARRVRVRYVLETHVHNDYVSGALEVRAATGATVAGPAGAGYAFDHLPMAEDDEIAIGGLRVRAMETPGHTAEHTSYLVFGDAQLAPQAVFTGGSLLVGSSGRTDLSGEERTESLARAQFRSLRRLALLPDGTRVLPTHGAGSSCAAGPASADRTTTVGAERRTNPVLAVDEEEFISGRSGLPPYPAYYRHMAPLNRAGPAVLGGPPSGSRPLTPETVALLTRGGALVVDARGRRAFAEAHLPGSLCNELDDSFAALIGQVVPFDTPLVLVLPEPVTDAAAEAVTQLLRIGYERVEGYLDGGIERWQADGRPARSFRAADAAELLELLVRDAPVRVLDVRLPTEPGSIPGALAIPVGEMPRRLAEIPRDREVWTVCGRGRRAAVAASLLDRADIPVTAVVRGGAKDLMKVIEEGRT